MLRPPIGNIVSLWALVGHKFQRGAPKLPTTTCWVSTSICILLNVYWAVLGHD